MESSTTPSKTLPRIETCSEKEDRNQEYQTGGHPLAVPLQELQDETMATEMENDRAFASAEIYRPITASRSRDTSRSKESQSIMLYKDDHVVKCKNFLDLGLEMHDLDPELFFPLRRPDNRAWWLDVQNAAPDTVRQVCRVFGVHPLTVEDIAAEESGEKIVTFPSYYFTCVRSFVQKTRFDAKIEYEPFNFYMVVFDSGVLSFSFVAHAHVDKVLERVQNLADHVCITPDFIHYAILDHIVDAYKPPIDQIKAEVDAVEDLVYTPDVDDMRAFTRRISDLQHRTDSCIRLLSGKRNILRTFSKHHSYTGDGADDSSIIEKEDTRSIVHITSYIDDVEDHVETHLQDLKFMNSVLSRSQENYIIGQDILSINGRRRIGTFLKFVGFLGLGFTMMLWVCGMFSMNVNANIPLYSRNTITAWLLIIGGCLLGGVIMVIIGRRIRWL